MIYLMRHFKVKDISKTWMNSAQFDQWVKYYDTYELDYVQVDFPPIEMVYVSSHTRALKTADFIHSPYQISDLVREVDAKAFMKTFFLLPKWFWLVIARIQWYFNLSQSENRIDTTHRINQFLETCDLTKNTCIITHGFVMKTLIKALKNRGFYGKQDTAPQNGKLYTFSNLATTE